MTMPEWMVGDLDHLVCLGTASTQDSADIGDYCVTINHIFIPPNI